jgi:tetratricopeptide (TPR) repeat protein
MLFAAAASPCDIARARGEAGVSDAFIESFVPDGGEQGTEAKTPLPGQFAADPIATGLVLSAAANNPQLIPEAAAYLRDARTLVQHQIEKLREEDPIIPVAVGEARLRRLALLLRIIFFSIAGLTLLALAAIMIWGAARSHNVVVEVFDVPPSFVARGMTGRAVASGLLDELQRLRDATRSSYTPLEAQSAWASDIKVIVPDTGISIGEIDHVLHARLGNDLTIQGELMETGPGRIALRVRGDGVSAKAFEGAPADLSKLTTQAAEWVYGQSQPHEYAAYLTDTGRDQDALNFLPGAFARTQTDAQRAAIANTWGVAYNDLNRIPEAVAKYREAMSLKPRYWRAWSNLIAAMPIADGEEATWREAQAFNAASDAAPSYDKPPVRMLAPTAVAARNHMLVIRSVLADISGTPGGTGTVAAASNLAASYADLHDWVNARRYADMTAPDDPMKKVITVQISGMESIDRGDFASSIAPLETLRDIWNSSPLIQSYIFDDCALGYAYGMVGRIADADAVFARNGKWSECLAWHGAVLAHAGRQADAEQIWNDAISRMPHLPETYLQRGRWRAAHQDPTGAISDFSAAHAGSPQLADPLKAWGDVLVSLGRRQEALAKYDEALGYAPAWLALKAARDSAARGS